MSSKRNRAIPFDERSDVGRLRVSAVAEVLDVAPSTVYRLIAKGQLRAARLGGVTSLKVGDVRALLSLLDASTDFLHEDPHCKNTQGAKENPATGSAL